MKIAAISKLLTVVFLVLAVVTISLSLAASHATRQVHNGYRDRVVLQEALADMYATTYRLFYLSHNYVVTQNPSYYQRYRQVLGQNLFEQGFNQYLALDVPDAERNMIGTMRQNFDFFVAENERALQIVADDWGYAVHILHNEVYSAIFIELDSLLEQVTANMIARTNNSIDQAASQYSLFNALMQVAIILTSVLGAGSLMLIQLKLRPIKGLSHVLQQLRNGDFYNVNKNGGISKDEIGELTADVYAVLDTIQDIDHNLLALIENYTDHGNTEYRINDSTFQGEWKVLVQGINRLMDTTIAEMMGLVNTVSRLANGEHDLQIQQLKGQKYALTQALESIDGFLNSYVENLLTVVDNAGQGNFDTLIDTTHNQGAWKTMSESINQLVQTIDSPLNDVIQAMTHLQNGDFNHKMQGRHAGRFKELHMGMELTSQNIASYVSEIQAVLGAMSQGDLTQSITREYAGLFGDIKQSVNRIADKLNSTMQDISGVSANVLEGATTLSQNSVTLANDTSTQQSSVATISTGIVHVDSQSKQSADKAGQSATIAEASRRDANQVSQDMDNLLVSMDKITSSSNEISNIIKTIEDIAFQTNLLSLNASVEAARAGEHGRGFSVVAEEVRTLASRSAEAAKQTNELIVKSIESVNEGTQRARDTAQSLEKIVTSIDTLSSAALDIKEQAVGQTESLAELSGSVQSVNQSITGVAVTSQNIAATAQELTSTADMLSDKLSFFKTTGRR